ncbi:ferritin-like fold-containing protein [Streptacidiphilus sp. ASG 303]|uniref:ferritin-like fold-containing protein n=1 Tax=Streptomycetaceae TaxID=2062 RepID=UPI001E5BC3B5|nr:ferritin-like fold-containing protein [Streptacidiphilus sp. ASG 303]MCD0485646.1 ferritin-like domain-containing protein [Streptacidiphilus sp. ASG 303]
MDTHGDAAGTAAEGSGGTDGTDAGAAGAAGTAAAGHESIGDWEACSADPHYRAAVVDLLGALAYGELSAFERLAEDAKMAPGLTDKAELAGMAAAEFQHYRQLHDRLAAVGADPAESMRPFVEPLDSFHRMTAPADWLEGLVKAFVGDAIAADFYREVAVRLDDDTRDLVLGVMADTGHGRFAVDRVRTAIEEDPRVGGRLALWGRRLMGEALSQAQRVVADRDALSNLLIGGAEVRGFDLVEVGKMFNRITEAHTKRMAALGLAS